jgi:hypothetical protein
MAKGLILQTIPISHHKQKQKIRLLVQMRHHQPGKLRMLTMECIDMVKF